MSKKDDENPLADLGDLDWDSALDEWEKNTFVPQVARDAESNSVAPPVESKAPRPAAGVAMDTSGQGTVIAPVPHELRAESQLPPPVRTSEPPRVSSAPPPRVSAPPPPQRGGLGQLFSKKDSVRPLPPPSKVPAPSERTRVAPMATTLAGLDEDALARSAGPASSVTRQMASPLSDAPPPYDETGGDPTVIGKRAAVERPDSETMIAERPALDSMSDAETETRHPSQPKPLQPKPMWDPEAPTSAIPSLREIAPPHTERERPPAPEGPASFESEKPISRWLDGNKTAEIRQRVVWLEEEARALGDPLERARALLVVSELCAMVGDQDQALAIAVDARDSAPKLALSWRQVRQLMGKESLGENLDAEASNASTPSARAHATLLAADVLRIHGDGDAAAARWLSASRLDPSDVRAHAARAALALAQGDHTSAGTDLAENSELQALDKAVATVLRLRGVERPGAEVVAMPINDGLRGARAALEAGETVSAAQALTEVAADSGLQKGATWLSAALGSTHIAGRRAAARGLKSLLDEPLARRQLAARGIELADPELVTAALSHGEGSLNDGAPAFEVDERAALLALAGQDAPVADIAHLRPLADALSTEEPEARARRVSGSREARAMTQIGRLLAGGIRGEAIDIALAELDAPRPPSAAGVALDAAATHKRLAEIARTLSDLPAEGEQAAQRHVAAALVAERAGDRDAAKRAWNEALAQGTLDDGILRAAAGLDPDIDLATELLRIADAMPDNTASAILRLESLARAVPEDAAQSAILDRVHAAAPELAIGAFLAERIARRSGDLDEVLRWMHERGEVANDPLETALDSVREALLVADRDPEVAGNRLEEAHRARPDDVALRELFERLAVEPPKDRAAWREARANKLSGAAKSALLTEAAIEHERSGDAEGALRAAKAAIEAGDKGLAHVIAERAEVETGHTESQTEVLTRARTTDDEAMRLEAYERLAELDEVGKKDEAAALLWHRTILEATPRHLASLRHVEHALIGQGRDDELDRVVEQIALALDEKGVAGGEVSGHAQVAARLLARHGGWEKTQDMARLAAMQKNPSWWSLRALNAHARVQKDDNALLKTVHALLDRTSRPAERAALLLRASEASARLEHAADARAFLEQAANEDPADVVTWGFLAEVREHTGEQKEAAEACEALARTSSVPEHQLLAWYDAARIWNDHVHDTEKAMSALEQAAEIDVTYQDVFTRLSTLYGEKRLDAELARLLEKRLERAEDADERVTLEVERARALGEMGELARAKKALESALAERPDHTTALAAMAELCAKEGDWNGAETAYVRLARLLATPEEQRAIYDKLGDIYLGSATNLSRAEVAFKEVLKRAPKDVATLGKLVNVYRRQGDVAKAVETQQDLVQEASEPGARLERLVELSSIYETAGRDLRKAEQVLESARKEFPTSVAALRSLAEFYRRQHQMPAMQILLDRAAGDARRSFQAGRFVTALFEVLHAAYDLRGKKDAAKVVAATLAAVEGSPAKAEVIGADARAVDPRLDDVLAPDILNAALRQLLYSAGDALDASNPVDLRALRAQPLQPGTPIGATVGSVATVVGLGALQILVSSQVGRVAIPLSSNPPTLLVGEKLMDVKNERARVFVVVRALKMILSRSSALLRGLPDEVAVLASALFTAFNPSFVPQGVDPKRVAEFARRLAPALPRNLDPTVGVIALEAAGTIGNRANELAAGAHAWANRVALLAIGDPAAALDAIAWARGEETAPTGSEERAAWVARNAEARDLMTFSVTDAYAEARTRLGLDR